jgi:hypothetical protein
MECFILARKVPNSMQQTLYMHGLKMPLRAGLEIAPCAFNKSASTDLQ